MSNEIEDTVNQGLYYVDCVERTDPPKDIQTGDWYRYVIGRGKSRIEGLKPGSLQTVTEHAHSAVDDLNTRITKISSTNYVSQKRK